MEKRRKREAEKQRQLEYEQQRKAELQERQEAEAAKEAAKRKAEEERRKEEEAADESRKAREQQRKAALEELQKVRRQSQAVREDIAKELAVAATADDKENIPKNGGPVLPADIIEKKSVEEQKRRASYGVVKNVLEQDSVHRKEAESVVAASRKAAEEVADVKTRIEANMERSGRGEQEGPVYYGINSTARRSSQDCGGAGAKKDINVINDDLADEIEAIRLAADFSSRRMLNDQKKESTAGSASSSRLRIRALLDKQTKQREEEDKVRQQKRESQDMSKFMWVYR